MTDLQENLTELFKLKSVIVEIKNSMERWNRGWTVAAKGICEGRCGNHYKETEARTGGNEKPAIGATWVPEEDDRNMEERKWVEERNGFWGDKTHQIG